MVRSTSADAGRGTQKTAHTAPTIPEMQFEAALAELQKIVVNMEEGHLPLEESIAAYQRGSALLRHCQRQLDEAERRIQILEENELRDFAPPTGDCR